MNAMAADPAKRIEKKMTLAEKLKGMLGAAAGAPEGRDAPPAAARAKLPVGQHEVKNWPVLDLGVHPEVPRSEWRLDVDGLVERPLSLDWESFMKLPQVETVDDFHCVTTWSRFDNRWGGVRFRTIAELAGVKPEARFVLETAYDEDPSGEAYTTNIPLEAAMDESVLLVHSWEGKPLPREHGGPVRLVTPRLYAWKGAKWLRRITFLAEDHPGFWEVRGYSNTADPWTNDRYS